MEACVHRMLYCSAVQSMWFRSQDFGLKAELGSTMGSDLVYSILSQNGTLIRRRQGSLLDCSHRGIVVQVGVMEAGSMEEAGSGHERFSHSIRWMQVCLGPR
jgi:hypothetical protein